ncbi:MAG: hypothetical protein KDE35_15885 [Geminicoccaceae bacterium]|nr:hypothetical protein [Geminicoccaceae bacterium]
MAEPVRASALEGLAAEDRPRAEDAGLRMRALEGAAKSTLRGGEAIGRAAAQAAGLPFAGAMTQATFADGRAMLRLGPDEWLLTGIDAGKVAAALEGHHALVEIGERLPAIDIEGPAVRDVLAGACPLDSARVVPGFASRTLMGKAPIVLECRADDRMIFHVNRSFLDYLWLLLLELARDAGVDTGHTDA